MLHFAFSVALHFPMLANWKLICFSQQYFFVYYFNNHLDCVVYQKNKCVHFARIYLNVSHSVMCSSVSSVLFCPGYILERHE